MTKALKAKSARRAAKRAKPKLNAYARRRCEVALIADEQDVLSRTWDYCNDQWAKASERDKKHWIRKCDCITGTMRQNIERASQLQAYSAKGALFQVMLIYSEVDALSEKRPVRKHSAIATASDASATRCAISSITPSARARMLSITART